MKKFFKNMIAAFCLITFCFFMICSTLGIMIMFLKLNYIYTGIGIGIFMMIIWLALIGTFMESSLRKKFELWIERN